MSKRVHSIDEMNAEVLWCRTFGHSWMNYARAQKGSNRGFSFILKCRKCGTQKRYNWTRRGGRLPAGYTYPDGYLSRFPINREVRSEIEVLALVEAGILSFDETEM